MIYLSSRFKGFYAAAPRFRSFKSFKGFRRLCRLFHVPLALVSKFQAAKPRFKVLEFQCLKQRSGETFQPLN